MKRPELIFNIILVPIDFLMFFAAGLLAYFLRLSPWLREWREVQFLANLPLSRYVGIVGIMATLWLVIFAISGLYYSKIRKGSLEEFLKIIIAVSSGMILAIIVYPFFKGEWFYSRFIILAAWVLTIIFVFFGRWLIRIVWKYFFGRHQIVKQRLLLIGNGKLSQNILAETGDDLDYQIVRHIPHLDFKEIENSVSNPTIDEIILCDLNHPREKICQLIDFCDENRIRFKFTPDLFQTMVTNIEVDTLRGTPLIGIKRTSLEDWGKVIKRLIDILSSLTGIIIFLIPGIILSILIKLDSSGPIVVKLKRVGQGREFYLYKFRSMIKNAEKLKPKLLDFNERKDGPLFKMKNDPRITRIGRIIRKYRIDEIPQLINILKGEMSLVGPRPHEPQEISQYEKSHRRSLYIKPGATGLAQMAGSSDLKFEEEIKLDTYYVENWSISMDIKIILKTLIKIFHDRSAC